MMSQRLYSSILRSRHKKVKSRGEWICLQTQIQPVPLLQDALGNDSRAIRASSLKCSSCQDPDALTAAAAPRMTACWGSWMHLGGQ